MFTTLEQTPLEIDLVAQARSTGWTVDGKSATHEVCNPGMFWVKNYPLQAGKEYRFSFRIDSIAGGIVQPFMGSTGGTSYNTTGVKEGNLVASGSKLLFGLYSDADTKITLLDIQAVAVAISPKAKNSIVWSEQDNTWKCFLPYNADWGFSLFSNLYTFKNGEMYVQKANSTDRSNFYGTDYPTIVKVTSNLDPAHVHFFQSISIQSNQLLITTVDGITTSLGQVSDLIREDFIKEVLDDGVTQVDVLTKEGVYSAQFLRDKNTDIISGDVLKGNYLTIELTTVESGVLKLFTVGIHKEASRIGVR